MLTMYVKIRRQYFSYAKNKVVNGNEKPGNVSKPHELFKMNEKPGILSYDNKKGNTRRRFYEKGISANQKIGGYIQI